MNKAADLSLDGVTLDHGDWQVRYDLRVATGQFVALLGPSGAGKSTLLNLVAGFDRPSGGDIRVGGQSILGLSPAQRPVTSLFQEHNLFAHLTVAQNVGLGLHPGLRLTAADDARVAQALETVGLAEYAARRPASLSGGQRQRVALARCLVRDRPILLLDEPFSALDPALRITMLDEVNLLCRQRGMTILMVSHDPRDALRVADRIAFLSDGAIQAVGTPAELLDRTDIPALTAYLGTPPIAKKE
jgi:thiamine transport system ATP-binding protein